MAYGPDAVPDFRRVAVPQPQCPLADNTTWRYIWAVGSLRPFDIVVGLILLTLLIRGDWVFKAAAGSPGIFRLSGHAAPLSGDSRAVFQVGACSRLATAARR
jgi:hypothetical protein